MFERTASSAAMLIAFVTMVRSSRRTSARATSVVVVPPVTATDMPSRTWASAASAIRSLSSRRREER